MRAVVVLRDGYAPSDALARELQDHVKAQTAPYKYPRIVEFADELPKTASGKVRRAVLRGATDRLASAVRAARMLRLMTNEPTKDIAGPEIRMGLGVMIGILVIVAIVSIVS